MGDALRPMTSFYEHTFAKQVQGCDLVRRKRNSTSSIFGRDGVTRHAVDAGLSIWVSFFSQSQLGYQLINLIDYRVIVCMRISDKKCELQGQQKRSNVFIY